MRTSFRFTGFEWFHLAGNPIAFLGPKSSNPRYCVVVGVILYCIVTFDTLGLSGFPILSYCASPWRRKIIKNMYCIALYCIKTYCWADRIAGTIVDHLTLYGCEYNWMCTEYHGWSSINIIASYHLVSTRRSKFIREEYLTAMLAIVYAVRWRTHIHKLTDWQLGDI